MNPGIFPVLGSLLCATDILSELMLPDLSGSLVRTHATEIAAMVERLVNCEQVEMPLNHRFSPGLYIREIFMPRGTFVIGYKHKTRHPNVILSGRARVMMDGEIHDIVAPCIIDSEVGVQKVLYIEEDMWWATIHPNPTDERNVTRLEEELVELSDEILLRKGNMDLDTLRMSVNQQRRELN